MKGSGFRVKGSGIRIKSLGGLHIWDFRFFAGQQLRIGRRSRFHDLSAVRFVYRCMIYQKARSQMISPNTPQNAPKRPKTSSLRLKMDLKVSSIFRFEKRAQPCLVRTRPRATSKRQSLIRRIVDEFTIDSSAFFASDLEYKFYI